MATAKKAATKTGKKGEEVEDAVVVQEPEGVGDIVDDEVPDEIAIRNVFLSLGEDASGVVVSVYRIDDKNKKEYLCECQPDDFSLDNIRDDWGGGKYRIYARNAAGHFVLNRVVRIAAPRVVKPQEHSAVDLMAVVSKLGEQQIESAREMRTMVLELMIKNQPAAQSFNPTEMMTSMMAAMGAMQKLLGGTDKTDPVEMLLKGLDLADRLGGGDHETGMADVLKEIVRHTAGPLAEAVRDQPPPAVPRRRVVAAPTAPAGKPVTRSTPAVPAVDPIEVAMEQLNKNIGLLLAQARRDSDTELWAELVIDNIPDDQWDSFMSLVFMDDFIDRVITFNPEVANYRPWFDRLVERIRWNLSDTGDGDGLTSDDGDGQDANDNHSQIGKNATTTGQGSIDGAVAGQSGHGANAKADAPSGSSG